MRNKLIGLANILFGFVELAFQFLMLMSQPKLSEMFAEFGSQLPLATKILPYVSIFVMLLMVYVIYIGVRLLLLKGGNENLFKRGVVSLVVTLVLLFILTGFSILSVISPIYSITTSL